MSRQFILVPLLSFALFAFFLAGYMAGRGHYRLLHWQLGRAARRIDVLERMYRSAEGTAFEVTSKLERLRAYAGGRQ